MRTQAMSWTRASQLRQDLLAQGFVEEPPETDREYLVSCLFCWPRKSVSTNQPTINC
jgi:hypothetical protein